LPVSHPSSSYTSSLSSLLRLGFLLHMPRSRNPHPSPLPVALVLWFLICLVVLDSQ
jgi:hypothetical protein